MDGDFRHGIQHQLCEHGYVHRSCHHSGMFRSMLACYQDLNRDAGNTVTKRKSVNEFAFCEIPETGHLSVVIWFHDPLGSTGLWLGATHNCSKPRLVFRRLKRNRFSSMCKVVPYASNKVKGRMRLFSY